MMFLVGVALAWLGIGSLIGVAFLKYHRGSGFARNMDWQLIAAIAVVWPWPLWVWYSGRCIPLPETARIGLRVTVFMGSIGLGWVFGLSFYDSVYPRRMELADQVAIDAMIAKVTDPKWTGSTAKREHLDEGRLTLISASPRAPGQNGIAKTAPRSGPIR
jgi:hypothetical protein